jgi:hypothetical protein
MQYRWSAAKTGYVYRSTSKGTERLHRFILGAMPGEVVDHADRNPLNNTRENIRIATVSNNRANSKKMVRKGNPLCRFKGVTKKKLRISKPWQAYICQNGMTMYLGVFATAIQAARAYDRAAVGLFKEFACTNKMLYGI